MDDIHFCACSTMEIYQISGDPDMAVFISVLLPLDEIISDFRNTLLCPLNGILLFDKIVIY